MGRYKRAINELIIILVLIAVAVPILFAIQSWLSTQTGKLPSSPQATASYSVVFQGNKTVITIKVTNQMPDRSLSVNRIIITYSGGNMCEAAPPSNSCGTDFNAGAVNERYLLLLPKSDGYYVFHATGSVVVNDISIELTDGTYRFLIKASGSGTVV